MIKHHNFFKTHIPRKDFTVEDKSEFNEIILEEFYLYSNGEMTSKL